MTVLKEARQRVSAPRERYAETVREQTEADEWATCRDSQPSGIVVNDIRKDFADREQILGHSC